MLKKFHTVKNPLTIIAIFAGLVEVSGTTILPFINISNQVIFVWFLISFPSTLVLLFFATLNWNHKALYAPSDYKDEENFIKTIHFDYNKLSLKKIKESGKEYAEKTKYEISISNLEGVDKLIEIFRSNQYMANIYSGDEQNRILNPAEHKSIWLGKNVPVNIAVPVIKIAKKFYPHLEYIHLTSDTEEAPDYIHEQIFIGGSTSTALELHLHKITKEDFNKLNEKMSQIEFHDFIKKIN